jgi:cell shape-determining protein MreC
VLTSIVLAVSPRPEVADAQVWLGGLLTPFLALLPDTGEPVIAHAPDGRIRWAVLAEEAARPPAALLAGAVVVAPVGAVMDADRLLVGAGSRSGIAAGDWAVAGAVLVGVVGRVDRDTSEVWRLTHPAVRLGARLLVQQDAHFVVAGDGSPEPQIQHPRIRSMPKDSWVVADPGPTGADARTRGFVLGRMATEPVPGGGLERRYRLQTSQPGLPAALGVLVASGNGTAGWSDVVAADDRRWALAQARVLGAGDPSGVRRSVTVAAGLLHGVRRGDAASVQGFYVGRVDAAGPWTCRIRLLADPGSRVHAALLGETLGEPFVLEPRSVEARRMFMAERGPWEGGSLVTAGTDGLPWGLRLGEVQGGLEAAVLDRPFPIGAFGRVDVWTRERDR